MYSLSSNHYLFLFFFPSSFLEGNGRAGAKRTKRQCKLSLQCHNTGHDVSGCSLQQNFVGSNTGLIAISGVKVPGLAFTILKNSVVEMSSLNVLQIPNPSLAEAKGKRKGSMCISCENTLQYLVTCIHPGRCP